MSWSSHNLLDYKLLYFYEKGELMLNKNKLISFFIVLTLMSLNAAIANTTDSLQLIQILKDDIDGVDGLGNPRNVKVLTDNSRVFVSSGDDNAFAIFNLDNDFYLTLSEVFKNSSVNVSGLEGASGVAYLEESKQAVVTAFYDGALTRFSLNNNVYQLSETISDGISYEQVFNSNEPINELDHFALLGAWDVIKTLDDKQLFVASYMSNAVAIFDIGADGKILFNRAVKDAKPLEIDLGKPISLAFSPRNDELYILGFDSNQLTIFERNNKGELLVKQVVKNGVSGVEQFVNPQKIVVSPKGKFLYVACSGSSSVVVFRKLNTGKYEFWQVIDNSNVGGSGLDGASSIAISSDGSKVYAAGEAGIGLHMFSVGVDGKLNYTDKLLSARGNQIKSISSITLTKDNQHLLVATGKANSLFVFKISSK